MRTLAALAALAFLAVSLAGCSSGDPERYPDGAPSSTSASRTASSSSFTWPPSSSSTSTGPAANDTNRLPTGSLEATLNGTAAAFNLTGSDPDGDAINWTFDFGDGNSTNGTTLPTAVAHNYTLPANTTAMNVTVTLTLSDGAGNATYNATLNVTAGRVSVTTTVTWQAGTTWCQSYNNTKPFRHGTPAAGVLFGELAVNASWAGKPFTADFGAPAAPVDGGKVAFYDAADAFLAVAGTGVSGTPPTATDPMVATGSVPAGAATAVFMNCANPEGITATFTVG